MAEEKRSRKNRQRKAVNYKQTIDSDDDDDFADSPPIKKHKTEKANPKKTRLSRDEKNYNKAIEKALKESQAANSPSSKHVEDDDFVPNTTLNLSSEEDFSEENFSDDSDFCSSPLSKKVSKRVLKKKATKKKSVTTKTNVQSKSKTPQSASFNKSAASTLSSNDPKTVPVSHSTLSASTANIFHPFSHPLKMIPPTAETQPISTAPQTAHELTQPISTTPQIVHEQAQPISTAPQTAHEQAQPISTTPQTTHEQLLSTPKARHILNSVNEPSSIRKFPKWTPPAKANKGGVVNIRPPTNNGSPSIRVGLSRHAKVKPLHRL